MRHRDRDSHPLDISQVSRNLVHRACLPQKVELVRYLPRELPDGVRQVELELCALQQRRQKAKVVQVIRHTPLAARKLDLHGDLGVSGAQAPPVDLRYAGGAERGVEADVGK